MTTSNIFILSIVCLHLLRIGYWAGSTEQGAGERIFGSLLTICLAFGAWYFR